MEKTLTYEEFYRKRNGLLADDPIPVLEPFNVYRLQQFIGTDKPMPYSRKDYYKISLIAGGNTVHYADKILEVKDNMLLFANPMIPYNWNPLPDNTHGAFCVFTADFFKGFDNILSYPLFQPDGMPLLSLSDGEMEKVQAIYEKMFDEMASDYEFKFDLMRNLVTELVHTAMKLRPATYKKPTKSESTASERITSIFMELLERQFPIESPFQLIQLKKPAEYASQLNVHINHLNKVLKQTTGKTTSALIGDRITQEARGLLKHTNWTIAEIAYCLGFEDPSYFIKHFKKHNRETTPNGYRG